MRIFLKVTFFAVFCSLFIVTANAQVPTSTPPASITSAKQGSKLEFPNIEGWQRSEVTTYPTLELGYSVNYDSEEAGRVTIYVYNLGLKDIPSDITHSVLKKEIERNGGEIRAVADMGYYQNVKELKNETIVLGGQTGKVKALHSVFNYSMKGKPLVSEIYLLGHKNHFIKFRATYPKVEGENENKALADLLLKVGDLLSI